MIEIKRLDTSVYKFRRNMFTRPSPVVDTFNQTFVCGTCEGKGRVTDLSKGKSHSKKCMTCKGNKVITLKFTVEGVEEEE